MGVWSDRIKKHDVWDALQILGTSIDNVSNANPIISSDNAEGVERIRQILAFTGKRLATTDPFLLSIENLNALNTNLREISTYLQLFVSEGDESRITTAISLVESTLHILYRILTPNPTDDLNIINESLIEFRNNITTHTTASTDNFDFVNQGLDEIKGTLAIYDQRLTDEINRLTTLSIEQQSHFSSSQDLRASEFSNSMTTFQKEFVNAKLEQQEEVATLVSQYEKELAGTVAKISNDRDKAIKTYQKDLVDLRTSYKTDAEDLMSKMLDYRDEVEKLVGIIGNTGITSGYLNEANKARRSLYIWQALTVSSLAGLIWVAYLMAFPSTMENLVGQLKSPSQIQFLFYQTLASRIFLSITFGVFAAYAARQAEKYMDADKRNRKLALELAAVGPYMAPLPPEMQNKFRAELAEKSFGVADHYYAIPTKDPVTFWDLLKSKEFEELIEVIMKKIKGNQT